MSPADLKTGEQDIISSRYDEFASTLRSLRDDQERRKFFEANPRLCTVGVAERLSNEVVRLVRVDLQKAEQVTETVQWLAEDLDDDYCRGRAFRAGANVSYLKGEVQIAFETYKSALECFERVGDEKQASITRSSALNTLVLLGEYEMAFDWAKSARQAFEKAGDRLRLARLEGNFATILFRQDRWQEAAERFKAAYEEFIQIGEFQDVAICLRNMAVCHASLNKFNEALRLYEQARNYCEENDLAGLVGEIDYNVAYVHYLRGEYTLAIELYRATRARCEKLGDRYHAALCDMDQSEIFLELNLVREAGELAKQARTSFDQIDMHYEAAKSLTYFAIAQSREGKAFLALDLLGKARETFVKERNRVWPALIDLYEALVLYKAGRPLEAARLAENALQGFAAASLPTKAMMAEVLLARLQLESGMLERAMATCRGVIKKLESIDVPTLEYQACFVLGQIEEASNNQEQALEAYKRAQKGLERLRSHVQAEELKIGILEEKMLIYESLVSLTLHHGVEGIDEKKSVFAFIERAKSRSLADLMAFRAQALRPTSATRSDQAQQVRKLREELNWYYRQIDLQEMSSDNRSREEIQQLREVSRQREEHLLRTLHELEETDREFSSLQEAGTVGLEIIQSSMPDNTQVVEYYISRGVVYACVLTAQDLDIVPVTVSSRVREVTKQLQFQLSKFRLGSDYVGQFMELITGAMHMQLRELYDELLCPIIGRLKKERLVIVPHGGLYCVPFHALFDGSEYLIDRFCISYAPSATVYYICGTKQVESIDRSLVVGVSEAESLHVTAAVEAAAQALPNSRVLVGDEATDSALKLYGEQSRWLFLATQGHFRSDNPMFSAIQFGRSNLSLFDLYNLRLAADVVMLYGCGSGFEKSDNGDELVGLTRGLLYAGARTVVTSLWDVTDESSIYFIRCFCEAMLQDKHKSRALQSAIKAVRDRYPNPYQWAPYLLIGEPSFGESG